MHAQLLKLCDMGQQRSPNSSGHSRGQDSGRSGGAGNRSGRHNVPPPSPPQQDSGRHKEKNNGYVVRPPGSEPLEGHQRYTKIREINSGAEALDSIALHANTARMQLQLGNRSHAHAMQLYVKSAAGLVARYQHCQDV